VVYDIFLGNILINPAVKGKPMPPRIFPQRFLNLYPIQYPWITYKNNPNPI
jgi:hypothetical protein